VSTDVNRFSDWKILFNANSLVSASVPSGGDKHFMEVAKYWKKSGADVTVMSIPGIVELGKLEGFDGPFVILPFKSIEKLGVMMSYLLRGILAVIYLPWGESRLIVYGTSDFIPDVLPGFLVRVFKPKTSFWVNCVFHLIPHPSKRSGARVSNYISYYAQQISLVLIRHKADIVIIDNSVLKNQLIERGFVEDKLLVTAMGTEYPSTMKESVKKHDACFVGRLHPSKGIFDLTEIWQQVCETRPGSTLVMIGGGPERLRMRLKEVIKEKGLEESILISGYLPRQELDEALMSSRVFVFPSHEEGFGISILEAMAFGLPVVAYRLPHYEEIFGDVITLVGIGDICDFADRVLKLLNNEELRQENSEAGRNLAKSYSWQSVAANQAEAIESVIRSRI
jgi:glycosyltransferase involved in cell wall biosynthesis